MHSMGVVQVQAGVRRVWFLPETVDVFLKLFRTDVFWLAGAFCGMHMALNLTCRQECESGKKASHPFFSL